MLQICVWHSMWSDPVWIYFTQTQSTAVAAMDFSPSIHAGSIIPPKTKFVTVLWPINYVIQDRCMLIIYFVLRGQLKFSVWCGLFMPLPQSRCWKYRTQLVWPLFFTFCSRFVSVITLFLYNQLDLKLRWPEDKETLPSPFGIYELIISRFYLKL